MGPIKTAVSPVGDGLIDRWLEAIEPDDMGDTTTMIGGVFVRKDDKHGSNRKGTDGVLTDDSVIHVYPNTMVLLIDGGRVIDYTIERSYYTARNDSTPSMFNGSLKDAIAETFSRFKLGSVTP